MNLKLLFNININENLEENWLTFKNETTFLYTYYFEMSRDECIGIFKLVQKLLAEEMIKNKMMLTCLSKSDMLRKTLKNT